MNAAATSYRKLFERAAPVISRRTLPDGISSQGSAAADWAGDGPATFETASGDEVADSERVWWSSGLISRNPRRAAPYRERSGRFAASLTGLSAWACIACVEPCGAGRTPHLSDRCCAVCRKNCTHGLKGVLRNGPVYTVPR